MLALAALSFGPCALAQDRFPGPGGQYAFVVPVDDLAVVSRVDNNQPLPELRFANAITSPAIQPISADRR